MKMRDVRQQNFIRLLREFDGKQREFADLIDESPSFVSQWKSGGRPIPDDTARAIEAAMGKPFLWLDELHGGRLAAASADNATRARLHRLLELVSEEDVATLEALVERLIGSQDAKKTDDL